MTVERIDRALPANCPHCGNWTIPAGTEDEQLRVLTNHNIGHYLPVADAKILGTRFFDPVDRAYGQALAYYWGREDEARERGEDPSGSSQVFAGHYAFRKRQYLLEELHRMPPLVDAYKEWRETGGIAS